jgi:hypothetical protein
VVITCITCAAVAVWFVAARKWSTVTANSGLDDRADQMGQELVCDGLELGDVWETDRHLAIIRIHNGGKAQRELLDIRASCACAGLEPRRVTIPAGETREIRVQLNLRPRSDENRAVSSRSFSLPIWAREQATDGPSVERYWVVRAKVSSAFRRVPSAEFGRRSEVIQSVGGLIVPIVSAQELERINVVPSPSFMAEIRRTSSDGDWDLKVKPKPGLTRGLYAEEILLEPELRGGQLLPAVAVPASLSVVSDFEVVPEIIQSGSCEAGTVTSNRVELRSLTGRSFTVEQITSLGSGIRVLPIPEREHVKLVEHRIGQGRSDGKVVFTLKTSTGEVQEVVLPLTGHGIAK